MSVPESIEFIGGAAALVSFRYRNHKGAEGDRLAVVTRLFLGECVWHPGRQWLLEAEDLHKRARRTFAVKDVLAWGEAPPWLEALCAALLEVERLKAALAESRRLHEAAQDAEIHRLRNQNACLVAERQEFHDLLDGRHLSHTVQALIKKRMDELKAWRTGKGIAP